MCVFGSTPRQIFPYFYFRAENDAAFDNADELRRLLPRIAMELEKASDIKQQQNASGSRGAAKRARIVAKVASNPCFAAHSVQHRYANSAPCMQHLRSCSLSKGRHSTATTQARSFSCRFSCTTHGRCLPSCKCSRAGASQTEDSNPTNHTFRFFCKYAHRKRKHADTGNSVSGWS